ncbi:hypothetical protein ACOMHN_017400 [Nucella lapillus]
MEIGSTEDISSRSSCGTVQECLQHVHTGHSEALQDMEAMPQDCTVKDAVFMSDHTDTSPQHGLYDGQTEKVTDENLIHALKLKNMPENDFNQKNQERMNEDFLAVKQDKRHELKGEHTVYPVTWSNGENAFISDGATNNRVTPRKHGADVDNGCERKQQDSKISKKQCPTCHQKKIVRKICFALLVIFGAANTVRYTTVFYNINSVDTRLVSSIVTMLFHLWCLYVYATSYHAVYNHLPRLLRLLQLYEDSYYVRVDCQALGKIVNYILICGLFFQLMMNVLLVVGIHTFLPSFKIVLSPFHEIEGPGLYIISFVLVSLTYLLMGVFNSLQAILYIGTYILVKEYKYVTRQLTLLLPSHEDLLLHETQEDNTRSGSKQSVTGRHNTLQKFSTKRNEQVSQKTESENATEKKQPAVSSVKTSRKNIQNPSFTFIHPRPSPHITKSKARGGVKQTHSPDNFKKYRTDPMKEQFTDDMSHLEVIEETPHNIQTSDKNQNTSSRDEKGQPRVSTEDSDIDHPLHQARDRLPQKGPRRVRYMEEALLRVHNCHCGKDRSAESNESHLQDVEDVFDHLCGQHQVLCSIVRCVQGCLSHFFAANFIYNMPSFCVVIFGLGSSSIQRDEAGFLGLILSCTMITLVIGMMQGIMVNDNAHSAQGVIYSADWSKLSDRLLMKVQLLSSRLGHCQIGYDVYGMFVIDRSAVLMVLGTLVTYTVVVLQFHQADVSMGHTAANLTALS